MEKLSISHLYPFYRSLILIATLWLAMSARADNAILDRSGSCPQIMLDGQPFLIIGGELGNSSASCPDDIERIFPKLHRMGLNTVLVPAYWDLIEPVHGSFDFSLIDKAIDTARDNNLKVVFLWFGAWKNSMSCYAPEWFKKDNKKYPRAITSAGKPLEIASAFSPNVLQADSQAFEALMRHIEDYDVDGTVLMVQIENEIGMLEDARDHSAAANKEYAKGVPQQLMQHLKTNKKALHPELLKRWQDNGQKMSGSWAEVFGDDVYTDEYFMAYSYAQYVEQLAQIARSITSRPLYVNAAMNSRGRKPGEYPSAGPLAHLKDLWHAGAPTVDILSPDLYDKGFTDWVARYALPDNPLFIPEIRQSDANAAQAFYVVAEHDALGLSPFSIENGSDSPNNKAVQGRALLAQAAPVLLKNQGSGKMYGLYFDSDSTTRVILDNGIKITASHYFTLPWDPRATNGSPWPEVGGALVRLAPMEYLLAGNGLVLKFEDPSETAVQAKLGEDGFLDNDKARQSSAQQWQAKRRIGLASVDEVEVLPDGSLKYLRRDCGDETHQGRHARIGVDNWRILHIKLYEY